MEQESFQIMQLFYTSMISRAIFTVGIFFMAWVALRVAKSVNENQNLLGQVFSTLFGAYTLGGVGAILALPVAATVQGVLGIILKNRKN